jgi:murein DD-endopeptidase MepM/ murein hydrolase activator NlpD
MNEIGKINETYDILFDLKNDFHKNVTAEAATLASPLDNVSVNSPFGPRWGTTHNGVDLKADAVSVKSPADGVVEVGDIKNDACGGTIIISHPNGFKSGFCHMQKINVRPGQQVKQGEIIGISGGGKNDVGHGRSDGRHLHFTLRKDGNLVNPLDYIDKSLNLKSPIESPKIDTSNTSNIDTSSNSFKMPSTTGGIYYDLAKSLGQEMLGLKEEKVYSDFGKNISQRFGILKIPKDQNPKIKSPVSGIIDNTKYSPGCPNQITIKHKIDNKTFYLQFCNITNPSVKNGESVSKGTLLGKTDSDVEVNLFDSSWNRDYISSYLNKEVLSSKSSDSEKKYDKSKQSGGFIAQALLSPFKPFMDKYDEDGNKIEKRWASPTEKEQPVDWLNRLSPTYKKKVSENIEKIKKLIK